MIGVHVFYPNKYRNGMKWSDEENQYIDDVENGKKYSSPYILHDFDVVVAYLSILNWKKYNGEIHLYTNEEGLRLFKDLGLEPLYDKVNVTLLEKEIKKYSIDANIFWAAHKVVVLKALKAPFVIMDLDTYIETDLDKAGFYEEDLGLFHFEASSLTYPYPTNIMGYEDIKWPLNWDWDSFAINVGIVYFGNQKALDEYTSLVLNFMDNNNKPSRYEKFNTRMTFAEQRIFGEFVDKSEYSTTCLITGLYYPIFDNDNVIGFTGIQNLRTGIFKEDDFGLHKHSNIHHAKLVLNHLWGYKAMMLKDKGKRMIFMVRALEKFNKDFPGEYDEMFKGLNKWYNAGIN